MLHRDCVKVLSLSVFAEQVIGGKTFVLPFFKLKKTIFQRANWSRRSACTEMRQVTIENKK